MLYVRDGRGLGTLADGVAQADSCLNERLALFIIASPRQRVAAGIAAAGGIALRRHQRRGGDRRIAATCSSPPAAQALPLLRQGGSVAAGTG